MKNNFLRSFVVVLISGQLYINYAWAQEVPTDPPVQPAPSPIDTIWLNPTDSYKLYNILSKWGVVWFDPAMQANRIYATDVVCVENLEGSRSLGCSLYDMSQYREIYKYDKNADPLFKFLANHVDLACEDEDCILLVEALGCRAINDYYSCALEVLK